MGTFHDQVWYDVFGKCLEYQYDDMIHNSTLGRNSVLSTVHALQTIICHTNHTVYKFMYFKDILGTLDCKYILTSIVWHIKAYKQVYIEFRNLKR